MFPKLSVHPGTECMLTDTLDSNPFLIFDATCHKQNHKPIPTPPSTVLAAADNHFLPPSDDDNYNDANPADLMVKYDGRGKKKGKAGHCHTYMNDDKIKALHGPYEKATSTMMTDMTMTTTAAIGKTWRRGDERKTMTMTMT